MPRLVRRSGRSNGCSIIRPVDQRWCLVHATHMTRRRDARPRRERRGRRPLPDHRGQSRRRLLSRRRPTSRPGGSFGIGSDSHISVSPVEELRWLEYGQRLVTRRRNVLSRRQRRSRPAGIGGGLYRAALAGGAQAAGRPIGRIAVGARADLVVIDTEAPRCWARAAIRCWMPSSSPAIRTRCATSWSADGRGGGGSPHCRA